MPRKDLEALFLANLPTIERIISSTARRHGQAGDDASDFGSWVKLRIIEDDYAILAKFRGESSLSTYLVVVITRLGQEYCVRRWGRWRPSAAAQRHGALGIRLEKLVYRDGMPLAAVGHQLRSSGETTFADRELAAILVKFPRRVATSRQPTASEQLLNHVAASDVADSAIVDEERFERFVRIKRVLTEVLLMFPEEERLLLRLHYMESMSVAEVARVLAVQQKPLYRRIERLRVKVLAELKQHGVDDIDDLFGDDPA